jgi:MscS family membrane protein
MSLTRARCLDALALSLALVGLVAPRAARADRPLSLPDKEEPDIGAGLDPAPPPLDRSTPRRAWRALEGACASKRPDLAAHVLNLGDVPEKDRKLVGAGLARQLCEVLRETGQTVAGEAIDDTPLGPMSDDRPHNFAVVARLKLPGADKPEEAWLRRFKDRAGSRYLWLLTRQSVSQIPAWYRALVKRESGRAPVAAVNRGLGPLPARLRLATPRDAAQTFVALCAGGKLADAAHLLDLSALPAAEQAPRGERLARRLGLVLGRIHPGSYARMSNDALGAPERDVPHDEEVVAQAALEETRLQLRLARYPLLGRAPAWLWSAATVADIDALYSRYGYGWAGDHLPPAFTSLELAGIQLWQWLGLAIGIVLALVLGWLASLLVRRLLARISRLTGRRRDDTLVKRLGAPIALALATLFFVLELPLLVLAPEKHDRITTGCKLAALLALGWSLVRIVDVIGENAFGYYKERKDEMGMAMVPVARKILKPIIVVIVFIVALQNVGMNVGGLLAGLGIAGLAISLAGKNTIENLFGSLIIAFDRPFRVGDVIKVGDFTGTVEDLGLRSTRIRTIERTVVTIPNAQLADSKVENLARRDRLRFYAKLELRHETSADQLQLVVDEVKRYLLAHQRVWQEGFSVRLIGFGDSGVELEIHCYVTTADWGEFTGIREAMLLDLTAILERAGSERAYTSRTIYRAQDTPLDAERARQASAVVAERRARGELCLPEIPEAVRAALLPPPPAAAADGASGSHRA